MSADELAYMSAAEVADRVRRRALSPVEIVEACIASIERRNPSLNAFVFEGFAFPPAYLERIDAGRSLSAMDMARDQAIRTEVYDAIQGVLATHEILVSPTLAAMPVANALDGDTQGPSRIEGVEVDPPIGWCLTYLTNFRGHPTVSVPAGLSRGLPAGIQLIGRRYADGDVLAAAAAVERTRPWRDSYRICEQRPLSESFSPNSQQRESGTNA